MAQKIDYGARKHITAFRPEKTWAEQTIYLLTDITQKEHANLPNTEAVTVKQCFCPECNSVQTLNTDLSIPKKGVRAANNPNTTCFDLDLYALDYESYSFYASDKNEPDNDAVPPFNEVVCPQCGHTGQVIALSKQEGENGFYWQTPTLFTSRSLSKYVRDNDKTTRIDDRLIQSYSVIGANGSVEKKDVVVNEVIDLVNSDIYVSTWEQNADRKMTKQNVLSTVNPYCYPNIPDMSSDVKYGVRRMSDMKFGPRVDAGWFGWNKHTATAYDPTSSVTAVVWSEADKRYTNTRVSTDNTEGLLAFGEVLHRSKLTEIESRFDGLTDDLYKDGKRNGLYLAAHHPGSNEENTPLDVMQMQSTAMMMIRYPSVYLHAAERTERILEDKHYAELRKQKENPDYEIKTPSDSGRARIFREELKHVAEELCAADDNVTKAIKGVISPKEMRSKLEFFVYGPNGERDIPKTIRLKPGEETKQDPLKATKALKRSFIQEPLAVASNVYTGLKLGIKTTDHLNQLIAVGAAYNETEPKRARRNGSYVKINPPSHEVANAGVIAPIRSSEMMSFIKKFAKSHDMTTTIQMLYGDSVDTTKGDTTTGYGLAIECLRMYGSITSHGKIADQPQEIKDNYEIIMKSRLKSYLEQKSIQEAYVDFIDTFKEKTPEAINYYAGLIIHDSKMEAAYTCYKQEGLEAAKEKHPVLAETEDPKQAIAAYEEKAEKEANPILTTRNGKPLFHDRNLKEIHDELSVMAQKCIGENQVFEYTEEELALEGAYKAPDAEGEWSFHLMKDSNDQLRTAQALHNCVADKTYTTSIQKKQSLILYMQDETAAKVGCIELLPHSNKSDGSTYYEVKQFQGDHDNVLPTRFTEVAKQWLKDKDISYADCSDVQKFGTEASIHGDMNADYHVRELDEADGVTHTVKEMKNIQEKRAEMAREYYGIDANGNASIPSVPEELMQFA